MTFNINLNKHSVLAFNPSTPGGRGRRISEFEASLVYRVSSRTARTIQRNPVSKKKKKKTGKKTPETTTKTDISGKIRSWVILYSLDYWKSL